MLSVELYEKSKEIPEQVTNRVISDYSHLIKWPSERLVNILDVGCGEGSTTVKILQELVSRNVKDYNIIAVDLMNEMISKAKEKFGYQERVRFAQMDISTRSIQQSFKESFDIIFSTFCLHWVTSGRWAKNVYEMLRPGGQTFIFVMMLNPIIKAFFAMNKEDQWSKYQSSNEFLNTPFMKDENPEPWLEPLLEQAGFKSIVLKYITSFTCLHSTIPRDLVEDFINDVIEYIFKHYQENDKSSGEICLSAPYMLILAEK